MMKKVKKRERFLFHRINKRVKRLIEIFKLIKEEIF